MRRRVAGLLERAVIRTGQCLGWPVVAFAAAYWLLLLAQAWWTGAIARLVAR